MNCLSKSKMYSLLFCVPDDLHACFIVFVEIFPSYLLKLNTLYSGGRTGPYIQACFFQN
jgi:hypothetical protein